MSAWFTKMPSPHGWAVRPPVAVHRSSTASGGDQGSEVFGLALDRVWRRVAAVAAPSAVAHRRPSRRDAARRWLHRTFDLEIIGPKRDTPPRSDAVSNERTGS